LDKKSAPKNRRIALATCSALPGLDPDNRLLLAPLRAAGYEPVPAVWDDPSRNWTEYTAVIIRSTWDYYKKPAEFLLWIAQLQNQRVKLFNPASVLKWNMNKRYLRELEGQGVPVIPTEWVDSKDHDLGRILSRRGWKDVVIKPVISAGGYLTERINQSTLPRGSELLKECLHSGGAMIQPYLEPIVSQGEVSLLFIDGKFSHSVCKRPARGEFRVQETHGGTSELRNASREEIQISERVLSLAPDRTLYARVDWVPAPDSDGGTRLLGELEVLEPSLFFGCDPRALGRVVDALGRLLA